MADELERYRALAAVAEGKATPMQPNDGLEHYRTLAAESEAGLGKYRTRVAQLDASGGLLERVKNFGRNLLDVNPQLTEPTPEALAEAKEGFQADQFQATPNSEPSLLDRVKKYQSTLIPMRTTPPSAQDIEDLQAGSQAERFPIDKPAPEDPKLSTFRGGDSRWKYPDQTISARKPPSVSNAEPLYASDLKTGWEAYDKWVARRSGPEDTALPTPKQQVEGSFMPGGMFFGAMTRGAFEKALHPEVVKRLKTYLDIFPKRALDDLRYLEVVDATHIKIPGEGNAIGLYTYGTRVAQVRRLSPEGFFSKLFGFGPEKQAKVVLHEVFAHHLENYMDRKVAKELADRAEAFGIQLSKDFADTWRHPSIRGHLAKETRNKARDAAEVFADAVEETSPGEMQEWLKPLFDRIHGLAEETRAKGAGPFNPDAAAKTADLFWDGKAWVDTEGGLKIFKSRSTAERTASTLKSKGERISVEQTGRNEFVLRKEPVSKATTTPPASPTTKATWKAIEAREASIQNELGDLAESGKVDNPRTLELLAERRQLRDQKVELSAANAKRIMPELDEEALKTSLRRDIAEGEKATRLPGPVGRIATKLTTPIAKFFDVIGELGPTRSNYLGARYDSMGDIGRVDRIVNKATKKLNSYDSATRQQMYLFLDGQTGIDGIVNPAARVTAKNIQTINNLIGKMLVNRGMMTEETFLKHKNQYIRHLHLKHMLGRDPDASMYTSSGKLNLKYLKERKLLTPAQEKEAGLLEDVGIAQPFYLSKSLSDIAKNSFYMKIRMNPAWTLEDSFVQVGARRMGIGAAREELATYNEMNKVTPNVPEIQSHIADLQTGITATNARLGVPTKDFVELTGKSWGPLSGAYIHRSIYNDIAPVADAFAPSTNKLKNAFNNFIAAEARGMAAFKVTKTALNAPTAVRNAVSGALQLNLSGIPLQKIPGLLVEATTMVLKGHLGNPSLDFTLARRHGLFKTNWAEGEIREVLDTFTKIDPTRLDSLYKGLLKVAKFYGKIDDVTKLAKFIEQRRAGKSIRDAVIEGQKWGMDYSLVDPAVKLARKHIVPFGTYNYKIAPLLVESFMRNPLVLSKWLAVIPGSYELFKLTNDIEEKDWTHLRRTLPLYMRRTGSYAVLPFKNSEGRWQWVNLDYFFPWQNFKQASEHILRKQWPELIQDVGVSHPFLTISSGMLQSAGDNPPRDLFTRQEVYNRTDPARIKVGKFVEWIYNQWAPSMLTRFGALGYTLSIGEKDKTKHTITAGEAAARWFGVNIATPAPSAGRKSEAGQEFLMKQELNRMRKDPTYSRERIRENREQMRKLMKELRKD